MLQRYHLLARLPHGNRVLADNWPAGWLLPIVVADGRERAPHVIALFLAQLNIHATVACITSGIVDQQSSAIDWLAVVDEDIDRRARTTTLRQATVAEFLERPGLVPVQVALLQGYLRLSTITSSALSVGWLADTTRWARDVLPGAGWIDSKPTAYRAELFESIWEFPHSGTSFFLKWRGKGPFLDPDVAGVLAIHGGARVPATVARDHANGRWLSERVRGERLAANLSPAVVGRVAEAMARVQMNLVPAAQRLRAIGVRDESLEDMATEGDRILDRLASQPDRELRAARAAIRQACADLDALRLPATWIHTDFVPENVFVDGDVVHFIDFDDPWIGPAPVAMEFLYSGLRRHIRDPAWRDAAVTSASEHFAEAWRQTVAPALIRQAFASTRLVAEVLRISRRLHSLAVKEKDGELTGFVEPAACESARRLVALANSDLARSPARSARG